MHVDDLSCWRCGAELGGVAQPFARAAECPHCNADLHVCKMCEYFDASARRGCREPVADEVNDKERSNFCGYFQATTVSIIDARAAQSRHAQSDLADLFGLDAASSESRASKAQASQMELNKLFGLDDSTKS